MSPAPARVDADVIVLGAGAVGSAAAWRLARHGARVIALDRWAPPHAHGSTHGRTRIIREAYFEDPAYVPLVQRAAGLWAELERDAGRTLVARTGGVMVGPPDGALVSGARRSAREHDLPCEELTPAQLRRRFPGFEPAPDMVGLFEPRAGVLFPEACVEAMLQQASALGASVRTDTPARWWRVERGVATVDTVHGALRAPRLVVAAGAWMAAVVPGLPVSLTVERQVTCWFAPRAHAEWFGAARAPISIWEHERGRMFYTIPDFGDGLKAAIHHDGELVSPDAPRTPPRAEETAAVAALLARHLPDAAGTLRDAATCLYTNTPDRHFLIDVHPGHDAVLIASACSGHGFKFASAIGEALAEWSLEGGSTMDLSPFRLARFARPRGPLDA